MEKMAKRLSDPERGELAATLPDWSVMPDRDAIVREWRFPDFVTAWGFMGQVALLAERADHHPEWSNTYGRVRIVLTTHDAEGLTGRDISLAKAIDALKR